MEFKSFFFGLALPEREAFAVKVGSSKGMLTQIAYGNKRVELGFADVICAQSGGLVGLDDLPLTERAVAQRELRKVPADATTAPEPSTEEISHG